MKISLLFFSLFTGCAISIMAQAPTFADLPGPEHVLVVYELPAPNNPADTISRAVKDYYQLRRGIPESNIVPLDNLPDREPLTYNGEEHIIKIVQSGDIIQDSTQAEIDSAQSGYQSSFHALFSFWGFMNNKKVC